MTGVPPRNPEWDEQILPSGLIIATPSAPRSTDRVDLPPDLRSPRPVLLLPASAALQSGDMLFAAPGGADLGFPAATLGEVIDLLREVPFEPATLFTSVLAGEIYHHPFDADRHLRYAADVFSPAAMIRIERFVAEDAGHIVFDLRLILALQRLLIMHAAPDPEPARGLTKQEVYYLAGALLGLADALPRADPPSPRAGEAPDWYAWTSFFAQSGAWYDDPYVLEGVARSYAAFADIASSPELADHPARTEVDDRMTAVYGLHLAEQLGVGLACAAITKAVDPDIPPSERAVHVAPGLLSAGRLADREAAGLALISATREELQDAFQASGERPEQIAWDHSVLERYPLICLPGGRYRLLSPRALVSWMTRGMHYRLLDAAGNGLSDADARLARGRFLTFAGALGEQYVLRLVRGSLHLAEAAGAVRVQGEVEFHVGRDRRDGPDVAIVSGPDLVLIEVYSGRMSLQARTDASSTALEEFVQRAVADKLGELARRIDDLLAGHLRYDGVDLAVVRQIWPVLVLAGDTVAPTPLLWGHLRSHCPRCFNNDARMQRPMICDLDDLESLMALIEEGQHFPHLLSQFLRSGAEEFPVRNWISQAYGHERRPSFVEAQYRHAMDDVIHSLFGVQRSTDDPSPSSS
jgi:hypothetical protein